MIRVVRFGVDTLEVSFRGPLHEHFAEELDELKAKAQREEHPQIVTVGGIDMGLQPQGLRPWPYLLKSDCFHLRLGTSTHYPTASVRLSALGLAALGHERLYEDAKGAAASVGAVNECGVSRLDLAVDFQGWTPSVAEMDNVVCAAEFRPVFPSTRNAETFQFGKGAIVVRVYNKSRELVVSGKDWMHTLWCESPDYDPAQDVWRFEVQYRREVLRELRAVNVEVAFGALDALLAYGLDWANLRVPQGTSTDRWHEDERWTLLRHATGATYALPRLRDESRVGHIDVLIPMIAGAVISVAARLGVWDLRRVMGIVSGSITQYAGRDGSTFEELARRRAEKLLG